MIAKFFKERKKKHISIDPQLKIIEKQFTIINYLNILTF